MTVWDVADERIGELGAQVGELPFVSHCYRRPRHLPYWRSTCLPWCTAQEEVEDKAARVRALLGADCRDDTILYSSAILKKTGLPRRSAAQS